VARPRRGDVRAARPRLRNRVLALPGLIVRPLAAADIPAADSLLRYALGGRLQARRGELIDVLEGGTGLLALDGAGAPIGIVTWRLGGGARTGEISAVAVAADRRGRGVGGALLAAGVDALRAAGAERAWLVTTNDNLVGLSFYQRAGWRLAALRPGAVDELRRTVKPSIPEIGEDGIPLRDELELELAL
jgi:ribosomal protein S18 acetylase RimI-like enzyme